MNQLRKHQSRVQRHNSEGVALITVMLIVAVVMALAYHLLTHHSLTISSSKLLIEGTQLREYAIGGELFARELLYADWQDENTREADTLVEKWAETLQPFSIEGVNLTVRIRDLSAQFNLNSLIGRHGPDNILRYRRLLEIVGIDENRADLWLDWIDDDQEMQGFGAEDDEYLLKEIPYRVANQLADDTSELMALGVFTHEELDRLYPLVTTLPTTDLGININTVLLPVLEALSPNFDRSQAELLVESERVYATVEEVAAEYAALGDSVAVMRVTSEYFQIEIKAETKDARVHMISVAYRDAATGKVSVVSRDYSRRIKEGNGVAAINTQISRR